MSCHELDHYVVWRKSRLSKLEQVFGADYFKGKSVLEVGAGFGLIGKYMRENWGANLTFTDGRQELVDAIKRFNPDSDAYLIDHENPWNLNRKFDFIIHWGLLYHLNNWKVDLACTVRHLNSRGVLCLESIVLDTDENDEIKTNERIDLDDQSISGIGSRPSASMIEAEFRAHNLKYTRYDDADLNADIHRYDWKVSNTKTDRGRRFWICYT